MSETVNSRNIIWKNNGGFVDNSFSCFRITGSSIESRIQENYLPSRTWQNESISPFSLEKLISVFDETIEKNYLCAIPFLHFSKDSLETCVGNVFVAKKYFGGNRTSYPGFVFSEDNTFEAKEYAVRSMISNSLNVETIKELKAKDVYFDICELLSMIVCSYSKLIRLTAKFKDDPEFDRRYFEVHIITSEEPEFVLQQEFEFKRKLRKNFSRAISDMLVLTYGWE